MPRYQRGPHDARRDFFKFVCKHFFSHCLSQSEKKRSEQFFGFCLPSNPSSIPSSASVDSHVWRPSGEPRLLDMRASACSSFCSSADIGLSHRTYPASRGSSPSRIVREKERERERTAGGGFASCLRGGGRVGGRGVVWRRKRYGRILPQNPRT